MAKKTAAIESDAAYDIPMDRLPRRYTWLAHWRDVLAAVQALHGLVNAGLPLTHGLLLLSQDTPNRVLFHVFYWMHRDMSGGMSLSEAMANRPDFFPRFCIDMAEAGEASGQLAQALDDLARELQEGYTYRRRVAGHVWVLWRSIGPACIAVAVVMLFVTPQLGEVIDEMGGARSSVLGWMLTANEAGVSLLILTAAIVLPWVWIVAEYSSLPRGPLGCMLGDWVVAVPGIGAQRKKLHLAYAGAVLARLLRAGVPMPQALRSAAAASGSPTVQLRLEALAGGVESGDSLAEAIASGGRWYPETFRVLIALGEAGGQLPDALEQVAVLFRAESRHWAGLSLEIGIPLSVCGAGLLVYVVYGGVFSALTEMLTQFQ